MAWFWCHSIATKSSFLATPKLSALALCISGEISSKTYKNVSKYQVSKHQTTKKRAVAYFGAMHLSNGY
jgi:hypothetical protein